MKKIIKDRDNRICIMMFVITIVVAILPLMSKYCINGHDIEYHLLRIESLKEGILIGKPFLKVNTLFFGGAGYASSMFYCDIFTYIPALLRVCGLSIGASYHIFVTLVFIMCYASTYYCTYKMTSNKYTASIAAILLTLCPYHMDDMLVRAACGEYVAFIFIPFVVYGLYNTLFQDMDRPWIFGIGFAGLILTHPATLVFNIIFAVVVFVVFIKKIIKNPKLVVRLMIVTVVTLMITAFQWMPMLEQMLSSEFMVSVDSIDMLDAALHMSVIFSQVFPGAGVLLIVLAFTRLFLSSKEHEILKFTDVLMICGVLFAVGASNIMPWGVLGKYFSFVQFPWRLFIMESMLLSMADAVVISIFIKEKLDGKVEVVVFAILAVSAALAINHSAQNDVGYYDYGDDYYSYKPYTANVIGAEWLPTTVTDRDSIITLSEYMLLDSGVPVDFVRNRAVITASVPAGTTYVDVPFIYYKGYKSTINTGNGAKDLTVTGEGINGMCRVYTEGQAGELTVSYKGTTVQVISYIMSLVAVAGIALCAFRKKQN